MRFIIGWTGFIIADSINTEVFTSTITAFPTLFAIILIGMLVMDGIELLMQ